MKAKKKIILKAEIIQALFLEIFHSESSALLPASNCRQFHSQVSVFLPLISDHTELWFIYPYNYVLVKLELLHVRG